MERIELKEKRIELKEVTELAPHLCQSCGGPMRLIGIEPHPVEANTDLLTYCCTPCGDFLVLPTAKQISDCLANAAEAREAASSTTDGELRQIYLGIERRWMLLEESYRFAECLHRFLDDAERKRASIAPLSLLKADNSHVTPIMCEKCGGKARLIDCMPCTKAPGRREIWTFKCETCGEGIKRAVEK